MVSLSFKQGFSVFKKIRFILYTSVLSMCMLCVYTYMQKASGPLGLVVNHCVHAEK